MIKMGMAVAYDFKLLLGFTSLLGAGLAASNLAASKLGA